MHTVLIKKKAVRVHQIPLNLTAAEALNFLNDLRQFTDTERPRFVIDCSQVGAMTDQVMGLLLCSLEEAMKSNGDVRLAALSAQAEIALERAGVSRIFESFPSTESAVQSFHQRGSSMAGVAHQSQTADLRTEYAA